MTTPSDQPNPLELSAGLQSLVVNENTLAVLRHPDAGQDPNLNPVRGAYKAWELIGEDGRPMYIVGHSPLPKLYDIDIQREGEPLELLRDAYRRELRPDDPTIRVFERSIGPDGTEQFEESVFDGRVFNAILMNDPEISGAMQHAMSRALDASRGVGFNADFNVSAVVGTQLGVYEPESPQAASIANVDIAKLDQRKLAETGAAVTHAGMRAMSGVVARRRSMLGPDAMGGAVDAAFKMKPADAAAIIAAARPVVQTKIVEPNHGQYL